MRIIWVIERGNSAIVNYSLLCIHILAITPRMYECAQRSNSNKEFIIQSIRFYEKKATIKSVHIAL